MIFRQFMLRSARLVSCNSTNTFTTSMLNSENQLILGNQSKFERSFVAHSHGIPVFDLLNKSRSLSPMRPTHRSISASLLSCHLHQSDTDPQSIIEKEIDVLLKNFPSSTPTHRRPSGLILGHHQFDVGRSTQLSNLNHRITSGSAFFSTSSNAASLPDEEKAPLGEKRR